MAVATSLYSQAVEVAEDYLGPAGERFLRRQITTHLGIEPEALQKKQLPHLIKWVRLAFAMLTHDQDDVDGLTEALLTLAAAKKRVS